MSRARALGSAVALFSLGVAVGALATSGRSVPDPGQPPDTQMASGSPTAPACQPAPIDQRAAAVLIVGLPGVTESSDPVVEEVLEVGVGGVLVTKPNVDSSAQATQLVSDIRARAARPIVVATGEEAGRVSTFGDVIGARPPARTLAARNTPEAVRAAAGEVGTKLAAIGVDLGLAPVADLDSGPAAGIVGDRAFSGDPAVVSSYALSYALGLADAGVAPTAKHFPGHGRVSDDTHLGLPRVEVGLDELEATDLEPFQALIDAGVPAVMTDHVAYTSLDPDLPASLSPGTYQLLREMGFEGVAITDSVGMGAVNLRWPFPEAAVRAISAGADAVLTTDGTQADGMRDALVEAVRSGRLDEARLDQAAARMVALAGGDPARFACTPVELPALAARPGP